MYSNRMCLSTSNSWCNTYSNNRTIGQDGPITPIVIQTLTITCSWKLRKQYIRISSRERRKRERRERERVINTVMSYQKIPYNNTLCCIGKGWYTTLHINSIATSFSVLIGHTSRRIMAELILYEHSMIIHSLLIHL